MGYSPAKRPVKRIKLTSAPNYWVDLYSKLRFKDEKELGLVGDGASVEVTVAATKALNTLIAEWNLDDAEGNLLPITPENIDELDKVDADVLLGEIAVILWPQAKSVEIRESRKKK